MANGKTNRKNIVLEYDSATIENLRTLAEKAESRRSNTSTGQFVPFDQIYGSLSKKDIEEMEAYCI